jgi:uracil-DNA glycosylase
MKTWDDLHFFGSSIWQETQEKLDELDRRGIRYNPDRSNLFSSLDAVDFQEVKVMVIGQDPYPNPIHCSGMAFSLPIDVGASILPFREFPATLRVILNEYVKDLGYPMPLHGDLSPWCRQGVLLWNALPTCLEWQSLSHNWPEWRELTGNIIDELNRRGGVVFVALGSIARTFTTPSVVRGFIDEDHIDPKKNRLIELSHPSPRGANSGRYPFTGSRVFSTVNAHLKSLGQAPIYWRL